MSNIDNCKYIKHQLFHNVQYKRTFLNTQSNLSNIRNVLFNWKYPQILK